MDKGLCIITLTDPEGNQTRLLPAQPKKAFKWSAYPHPDLSPMTEEERAIITAGLQPLLSRSLIKRISMKFKKKKALLS